jgi:hypothetical protein
MPDPTPTPAPAPASPASPGATPPAQGEQTIPKARFDEVNERMKEAEKQLAEIKAAEEKVKQDDLKAKGEFQKVAEEEARKRAELQAQFDSLKPKADQLDAFLKARREEAKKVLKDAWLPEYDTFSLESLEKLLKLHVAPVVPGVDGSRPSLPVGKTVKDLTPEEIRIIEARVARGERITFGEGA